ncbi:unnamed protein product [Lactuca virosa]|uniref:Uncharacterized protein n=1 Tax=Lactuca virosa TaxID=75947 RepID=A0AAU9M0H7_9ASTR|nr:unnamed protein product [Lactuca virosa]
MSKKRPRSTTKHHKAISEEQEAEMAGGGGGGGEGHTGGTNWRYQKLDMTLFDSENPNGWILRIEGYFNFYRLSESDKMEAAVVALEGDTQLWF